VTDETISSEVLSRAPLSDSLRGRQDGEEQFRFLAEAMPQIVWTALPDGRADYFNQCWREYTDLTLEQSQNQGWHSRIHPDDLRECNARWAAAIRAGEPFQIELRFKRAADGTYRWHLCQGIPRRGSDGRISKWLGTCTDIQDQKLAERKLRHTRERFRLLVEGVKEYAIYMLDPDGDIVSWNAGAERIKGYSAREVIGRHCSLFYTPEDIQRDKPNQELKEAAAKGSAEDEGWRQRKDGSRFWASVVVTALRDEAGQLRGFAKVTRDMTERRRAEEGLRRYEELVKNAPIGLIVLHLEKMGDARTFRILAANPAVIQINRMQGVTVSDLIGKTLVETFPVLFTTNLPELYAAVIRSDTAR